MRASGPGRQPGPGRRGAWRALAGAAVLALAAGAVAAQAISGGSPAGGELAVRELAYRTAAAAAAQPPVSPGHWVYWREKVISDTISETYSVWTTAAATRAAYSYRGWVGLIKPDSVPFIGQPIVIGKSVWWGGRMPITYAGLGALPASPQALVRYLGHLNLPGLGPPPNREFTMIADLLTTYVMPPQLTAELYRALAYVRGVTIDRHAVDVAGRRGAGFRGPQLRGGAEEIIINPHTYRLMGQDYLDHRRNVIGTAVLTRTLVSGPGVQP